MVSNGKNLYWNTYNVMFIRNNSYMNCVPQPPINANRGQIAVLISANHEQTAVNKC